MACRARDERGAAAKAFAAVRGGDQSCGQVQSARVAAETPSGLRRDPSASAVAIPIAAALGQPLPVNPVLYAALAVLAMTMFSAFAYWTAAWTKNAEAAMSARLRDILSLTPGAAISDMVRTGWSASTAPAPRRRC